MAFLETICCSVCNKTKQIISNSGSFGPRICRECSAKQAAKQKKKYLAEYAALPLEERIAKIEEWIYEHNKEPHGYQWPPRF